MSGPLKVPRGKFVRATRLSYAMSAEDWERHTKYTMPIANIELIPIPLGCSVGPAMEMAAYPFGNHGVMMKSPDS